MNRIILSCLMAILLYSGVSGQSPFWTEKFSTPEGWTLEDNWTIDGGMLYFDWNPTIYNFDQHAVSPFIELDTHVEQLIITQSLQVYNPTEDESAQVIVTVGEEEFILWDYSLSNGNWGNSSGSELILELNEFVGETIQITFRTFGETTFNWSWWQVHEVRIMGIYQHDLTITNIQGPKRVDLLQPGDWVVEVTNQGSQDIGAFTLNLLDSKSNTIVDQINESNSLLAGESQVYGLSWSPNTAYNTLVYGQVVAEEDELPNNNLSEGLFLRIEPDIDYSILVWDNDNGIQSIICPEEGDVITPITGLQRALDDAGLEYDLVNYLPDELDGYDVIISTLGCYCLS